MDAAGGGGSLLGKLVTPLRGFFAMGGGAAGEGRQKGGLSNVLVSIRQDNSPLLPLPHSSPPTIRIGTCAFA